MGLVSEAPTQQSTTRKKLLTGLVGAAVGILLVALVTVAITSDTTIKSYFSVIPDETGGPTSLIAIITPTILNECTGCQDTFRCNIPSAVGGGTGCVEGWIRIDKVKLDSGEEGAWVRADVTGMPPNSAQHCIEGWCGNAWHIHQAADSAGGDGFTLGGHFNPWKIDHGCPDDENGVGNGTVRHVGDMGNFQTDEEGNLKGEWFFDLMRFSGPASIVGRSILLFQDPDQCTTMAAGYRWGWGILGVCDDDCQEKYTFNSTREDCFPEDWDCGTGTGLPYGCCSGLKCQIEDVEADLGTCIIDPGM
jgi:Cu-Zn family superoxide dismutase